MYKPQWRPKRFSSHRNDQFFPGLGGNSLLDCVVFGRVAGKAACKYTFGKDERLGKKHEKTYGTMGISMEKPMGKAMESSKSMEQLWKNHGKNHGKLWKNAVNISFILAMIYRGSLKHCETI